MVAPAVAVAEWANIVDRSSRFGQLTLTSTATSSSRAGVRSFAARPNSSVDRPHTDAMTRAPRARSAGRSWSTQCSTPGPCRPTALSMPAAVMCSRGAGLPGHS